MDEGKIDPSSPYYLGAGDQPGNWITHVVLKGEKNYLACSREITLSLGSHRKFVFVDGTITKPTEKKKHLDSVTVNSMLVAWIMRTTYEKVASTVPYFDEAKKLWDYLSKRYRKANGPRLQQLRAVITACKQTKGMSLEEYYATLMGLFDDLNQLKPPHGCECGQCTCDIAGKYGLDKEEERLHQFLIGMDDDLYAVMRSNLLSQQPLSGLEHVYETLLQEENSRGIARSTIESTYDTAHMFAVHADREKALDRRDKTKLHCSHFQKNGHDNSSCFKLHGYPDWWPDKSHVGKPPSSRAAVPTERTRSLVRANAVGTGSGQVGSTATSSSSPDVGTGTVQVSSADLKPEHIQALLNMVNHSPQDKMIGPTFGEPDWSR
ncbi:uncharacterized protein [Spinacia oleracea]|uniref:Retrotransposon Copia-like N-terminal domain-containing protein n=1 Tax=Spinacia oleracea TaxID=3562 RepID=A0ABM3R0G7_SPIOL|nr:uncharacterized protein LOC110799127 [Spinacia oleracea]